ncbi:MAG: hypothetical protein APF80_12985 [Alphaproteobacteria bacterium BRH_c36]|nr:MAG: hypothetical protein APF80_12985 [Alphaproteobacteria bacterium BRH_c36]
MKPPRLSRTAEEKPSALAAWCARVAVFSAALVFSALFLHRLFSIPTPVALNLLKLSIFGGLVALALGALATVDIWRNASRGVSRVVFGGLVAICIVGWPLTSLPTVRALPEINDVTTDTQAPPQFEELAAIRPTGANRADYPGEVFGAAQRQAYPDLKPLLINRSVAEAYDVSVDAVRRLGMKSVSEVPPGDEAPATGHIEAVDRTMIWGFYDDVVIRVAGNRLTAQVDVRSASRFGRHDLGRNATRVRQILAEIVSRLEATVTGPRTSRAAPRSIESEK